MNEKRTPDLERCFRLYRIEGKPGKEVAEIMGTNMPNVSRWSQRFEQRFPERARKMIHDAQLAAGMRVMNYRGTQRDLAIAGNMCTL